MYWCKILFELKFIWHDLIFVMKRRLESSVIDYMHQRTLFQMILLNLIVPGIDETLRGEHVLHWQRSIVSYVFFKIISFQFHISIHSFYKTLPFMPLFLLRLHHDIQVFFPITVLWIPEIENQGYSSTPFLDVILHIYYYNWTQLCGLYTYSCVILTSLTGI